MKLPPDMSQRSPQGSISLMILVLLVVFVVIAMGFLGVLSRQSHEETNQIAGERMARLAESGINYAVALLSPDGGAVSGADLTDVLEREASNYPVLEPATGDLIGTFSVTVVSGPEDYTGEIKIQSVGRTTTRQHDCRVAEATLRPYADRGYLVISQQLAPGPCLSLPPLPFFVAEASPS